MIVYISGNISAGKSTVLQKCAKDPSITLVHEPVLEWEKHGLLAAMYDKTLTSGEFQMMALITRYEKIMSAQASRDATRIVCERSLWEDCAIFAKTTLDGIHLANYQHAYNAIEPTLDHSCVHIILHVEPEVALRRISKRARPAEKQVTLEYLQQLADAYERFEPPGRVIHVDANGTEEETWAMVTDCLNSV